MLAAPIAHSHALRRSMGCLSLLGERRLAPLARTALPRSPHGAEDVRSSLRPPLPRLNDIADGKRA
eukprot:5042816-Prymnesium_polylepis.1